MRHDGEDNGFDGERAVGLEEPPSIQEVAYPQESTSSSPQRKAWGHLAQVLATGLPLLVADIVTISASVWIAWAVLYYVPFGGPYLLPALMRQLAAALAIMFVVFPLVGLFPGTGLNPIIEFRQSIIAASVTYGIILIANAVFGTLPFSEFCLLAMGWLAAIWLLPLSRIAVRKLCGGQNWWGQPVLIIGNGPRAAEVFDLLRKRPKLGLYPVGFLGDPHQHWSAEALHPEAYLGPLEELQDIARKRRVYWAILALDDPAPYTIDAVASSVPNLVVLTEIDVPSLWTRMQECADRPAVHVQQRLLLPLPRITKRTIDLAGVILGGVLVLPILLVIALLIKLTLRGPVFYGHERIGLNGRRFRAWKLRTMRVNADQILQQYLAENPEAKAEWDRDQKLKNDPRVIPYVGKFLRALSLDELPQLWNVLVGEMSLVGPRPIVNAEIKKYSDSYPVYLKVVPGITGLWQVSGRNNTTYEQRVQFDTYYVRNWSPWLDAYILARTIKVVLLREGAY